MSIFSIVSLIHIYIVNFKCIAVLKVPRRNKRFSKVYCPLIFPRVPGLLVHNGRGALLASCKRQQLAVLTCDIAPSLN